MDALGIGEQPGAAAPVLGRIHPLRTEALRTAFVDCDTVLEICRLPGGDPTGSGVFTQKGENAALEIGLADGVLDDEPGGLGAVFAGDLFGGPAVLGDQLA